MKTKIEELKGLCEPLVDYLKNNYDPHATIIVSEDKIQLVRTEIGIPNEKATLQQPNYNTSDIPMTKKEYYTKKAQNIGCVNKDEN